MPATRWKWWVSGIERGRAGFVRGGRAQNRTCRLAEAKKSVTGRFDPGGLMIRPGCGSRRCWSSVRTTPNEPGAGNAGRVMEIFGAAEHAGQIRCRRFAIGSRLELDGCVCGPRRKPGLGRGVAPLICCSTRRRTSRCWPAVLVDAATAVGDRGGAGLCVWPSWRCGSPSSTGRSRNAPPKSETQIQNRQRVEHQRDDGTGARPHRPGPAR